MTVAKFYKQISSRKKSHGEFSYGVLPVAAYLRAMKGVLSEDELEAAIKEACEFKRLSWLEREAEIVSVKAKNASDIVPEGVEVPANTLMVFRNTITTPREDRDGDILHTEGGMLDPKAPLLWQHMPMYPIGRTMCETEHDKKKLKVCTALLDLNQMTEDAAKLIEADALRISHGFRATEVKPREDESGEPIRGWHILKFEILEQSLVSVPSNVDAEIEMYSRGGLKSAEFQAHARKLWDEKKQSEPTRVSFRQMTFLDESGVEYVLTPSVNKGAEADEEIEAEPADEVVADELVADELVAEAEATEAEPETEDAEHEAVLVERAISVEEAIAVILTRASALERERLQRALEAIAKASEAHAVAESLVCVF